MPRTSPYQIVLSDEERRYLEAPAGIRHRIGRSSGPGSCCTPPRGVPTTRSPQGWTRPGRWCRSGASASSNAWPAWPISPGAADPRVFPPEVVVAVKALACELPSRHGVPLSRWHCPDLARTAVEQGIVASISDTTIWRWLSADAIKPWRHRSWIFPRDPDFAVKAACVLALYARSWQGGAAEPR